MKMPKKIKVISGILFFLGSMVIANSSWAAVSCEYGNVHALGEWRGPYDFFIDLSCDDDDPVKWSGIKRYVTNSESMFSMALTAFYLEMPISATVEAPYDYNLLTNLNIVE